MSVAPPFTYNDCTYENEARKTVKNTFKKAMYRSTVVHKMVIPAYHTLRRSAHFNSKEYWERRYKKGGNSGAGSYGRLAEYKAKFLNTFAREHGVGSVIEFGSGDGNQLGLFKFRHYTGLDVSKTSIARCMSLYAGDKHKSFYLYDPEYFLDNFRTFRADLTLSLDVIYHLVEDSVFEKYMHDLFAASDKYVIIYASNTDTNKRGQAQHVRHRKFTDWVTQHEPAWKLVERIENRYRLQTNEIDESFADFYVYKKGR